MSIYLIPLLAPMALVIAGLFALCGPSFRPAGSARLCEIGGLAAIAVSAVSLLILAFAGAGDSPMIGTSGFGLSLRLDVVSGVMMALVSFIGWVVLRYSTTYLDGENGQGAFMGWMSLTIACVLLLVQSGTVVVLAAGWIAASLCLHYLLVFYPARAQAQRAAWKKFVIARLGDLAIVAGAVLLIQAYGTGEIAAILSAAAAGEGGPAAIGAAWIFAFAAILKSAQLPVQGWLLDILETPTPVSALMHAGFVNAGGFLLIRFADVMLLSPGALAALVLIGGATALVAGIVMLTQPAVKTALAWSTVAQMGFMILQCGLALFPIALLHIVAHALYKAHAFLRSGSAVQTVTAARRPGPVAVPGAGAVFLSFAVAIAVFLALGYAIGFEGKPPQAVALGAILIFGVAYLLAQGMASAAPRALAQRTGLYALVATLAYFTLQEGTFWLTQGTLPAPPVAGVLEWTLIVLAVTSFGAVALAQTLLPNWSAHPAARVMRVHLANGLYFNAMLDRLLGGWRAPRSS